MDDVAARRLARGLSIGAVAAVWLGLLGSAAADPTNLQETQGLVWVMVAISVAGAILVWGIMTYALLKFRDPRTKGRRYG